MKLSKIKISLCLVMIVTFVVLFMFTYASGKVAGGNEWGHGSTMEEACANAKAIIRMKCENPVMSDLRIADVSIDENSIVVSQGSVVIGYLFFAVIYFLFGAIAGSLFYLLVK